MLIGAALLAIGMLQQIFPQPPSPPAEANVTVRNEVVVQVPEPDPEATAQMASWSFSGIVVTVIAPTFVKWTNDLLNLPDFIRTTPPDLTYGNSTVSDLAQKVRAVATAIIGLAVLAWALTAMMRGGAESPGRIVYGLVLALGNLTWWKWGIDLNNAITGAIAAPELRSVVRLEAPSLTGDPTEAFAPAVVVIATAIVCILLIGSMVFRLGFLDILIVLGSLGLICKSAEATDRFAETYIGLATGTLFSQITVVLALKLATVMGIAGGGITSTLLSLVILLLARRMPGLLANRFSQPSGGGIRLGAVAVALRRAVVRV